MKVVENKHQKDALPSRKIVRWIELTIHYVPL